jgi:hypothetical protein
VRRSGGACCASHFLLPGHWRQTIIDLLHRDAAFYWADECAQVAADTFFFDDARYVNFHSVYIVLAASIFSGGAFDALVCAVFAGHVAELAADAEVGVYLGYDFVV